MAAVVVAVGFAVVTDRNQSREHEEQVAARSKAASQCLEAVVAGEQGFRAGTEAVATLAGAVVDAGDAPNMGVVEVSVEAVYSAQKLSKAALATCAASAAAPEECKHTALVLTDAAHRQEVQAQLLRAIAQLAATHDQKTLDVRLAQLTQQRSELEQLVATANDADCAAAAAGGATGQLPDITGQ